MINKPSIWKVFEHRPLPTRSGFRPGMPSSGENGRAHLTNSEHLHEPDPGGPGTPFRLDLLELVHAHDPKTHWFPILDLQHQLSFIGILLPNEVVDK